MYDSAIPRNGFLIPDIEKCDRQIGMQKLGANIIRIYVYNNKTNKHEAIIVSPQEFLGDAYDEIQRGEQFSPY